MIEVQHLTKRYGRVTAVNDVILSRVAPNGTRVTASTWSESCIGLKGNPGVLGCSGSPSMRQFRTRRALTSSPISGFESQGRLPATAGNFLRVKLVSG